MNSLLVITIKMLDDLIYLSYLIVQCPDNVWTLKEGKMASMGVGIQERAHGMGNTFTIKTCGGPAIANYFSLLKIIECF